MNRPFPFRRRPFIPLIFVAVLALVGLVVMSLWNALMPDIFHLPAIGYWQALGLFILGRLLIGGFSGGRRGRGRGRRREMIHHLRERWQHMTPEQQEKFRRGWKNRWNVDIEEEMSGEKPQE